MTAKKNTDLAQYFFHEGTNFSAYEYLGAHKNEDKKTVVFRTWAPGAKCVYLAADFNGWQKTHPLVRETEAGLWSIEVGDGCFADSDLYKFIVESENACVYKADPYAFYAELPPKTASRLFDISKYSWNDSGWLDFRKKVFNDPYNVPMNIYEVHLGSWKKKEDGSLYTYRELAVELSSYVKKMGYTHIELMPVMEHPFDGSWGYQVSGYYAPTSRYGTPEDFKYFVDYMHSSGIGVILDWVPAHFPKDEHGLYEFDGGALYEYQGKDRQESSAWGTRRFDVARNEVQSFLISNAIFWLKEYHIDGLRVDAVASMLYLDFDKKPGEWFPNEDGTNHSYEAIAFFQKLGTVIREQAPYALLIAEESTSWKDVTKPASVGGLGFTHKWNMGWMNDVLDYIETDPLFRKYHHEKVTFSMMYAFSENFILPISHDEVVHGKKSLLDKAVGDYWQKFASTRAFLTYMMTHPGKKLMFMGCEIGQFKEWDYKTSVEWFLLDYEMHNKLHDFVADLNHFYLENAPLWQCDDNWRGFEWMDADNRDLSLLSYVRYDKDKNARVVIVNFTPIGRNSYKINVPFDGEYFEIFNSDSEKYGGTGIVNNGALSAKKCKTGDKKYNLELNIGPYGAIILDCRKRKNTKKVK